MATIKHIQTPDGVTHDIGGGGGSTTYTLTKSGSTITLTGSGGDVSSVVDANTTYALSISGHTLTLTPSSGSAQSVTIPDDNTTYTIGISGATITLTPSSGSAQTITIPDATTSTAGVMSASDKTKLDGIQSGAEVNVQADWNQSNSSADDYIKNKPSLATVATTGDYDDLTNKPTIPTVNDATLTIQKNGNTVETFTANSNTNKTANITVPTKTSELNNDSGFITTDEDTTYSLSETDGVVTLTGSDGSTSTVNTVTDVEVNGSSVVTDGVASVTVPTATSDLTNDSNFVSDASYVHTDNNFTNADATKLSGIEAGAEVNVQANWTQADNTADDYIKNKPSLATVATSGDYDDLTNKPTIPTVNDATLTIQKNGTNVETFTANSSTNKTANITVPTATSDLTNDSGFTAVSVTQTLSSGTKIAEIDVDGTTTDLYAPSGGSGGVSDVLVDNVSVVTGGVAEIDLTGKQNVISDIAFSSGTYSGGLADRKLLQSSTITLLETMVNSGISDGIIDQVMQFLANFVGKFTFDQAGHFQVGTLSNGFYWRVNDINGTPWHQVRIHDDGRIVYEQYDGSTWTTIWTNMRGKSVRVWTGTLWPVVSQTGITWTDDGLWTSVTAVFSAYENGQAQGYAWHCYTVPREYIRLHNGQGHTVILANSRFAMYGTKYIYFYLDHLGGNDHNDDGSYTARGMTAANNNFVIREVYLTY